MISELPFFELLILTLLPLTIGLLLFVKVLKVMLAFFYKSKQKTETILLELGDFLLFLVFFVVIINIVLYMVGDVPSDFSIFDYLIEEALPLTWYTILFYGILINLFLLFRRVK